MMNNITGTIPSSIGNLQNLYLLYASSFHLLPVWMGLTSYFQKLCSILEELFTNIFDTVLGDDDDN